MKLCNDNETQLILDNNVNVSKLFSLAELDNRCKSYVKYTSIVSESNNRQIGIPCLLSIYSQLSRLKIRERKKNKTREIHNFSLTKK